MYDGIILLMKNMAFDYEYSIGTIKHNNLYDLAVSHKKMLAAYGEKFNFDPEGYKYHREVSKANEDGRIVYARIEFINPTTDEELVFTWDDKHENEI